MEEYDNNNVRDSVDLRVTPPAVNDPMTSEAPPTACNLGPLNT